MTFWKTGIQLIMLCLFLTACDGPTGGSQPKFCATDYAVLMRDSAVGKEGAKYIENLQVSLQKELDVLQEKVEKNPQDQKVMQEYQQSFALIQQRLQNDAQNVANEIIQFIDQQLETYRKNNGFDAIIALEALYAHSPEMDRTSEIIAWLDSHKESFKLTPPQTFSPEAPAGPTSGANTLGAEKDAPKK